MGVALSGRRTALPDCNTRNRTGPGHVDSEAESTHVNGMVLHIECSCESLPGSQRTLKDERFTRVTDCNCYLHVEKR